jgi:hypothetical protein
VCVYVCSRPCKSLEINVVAPDIPRPYFVQILWLSICRVQESCK